MNACTAAGMIYAPTHAGANATTGCVASFTFTQGLQIDSGATVNGGATINGGLSVPTNDVAVTNNVTVGGRTTTNELFVGSGNVGNIPTCASNQKIHWNGTAWACQNYSSGDTTAAETDPQVGGLSNGRWCRTNGSQVICDVNVPVACGTSQKLYWNGSSWSCIADQGLTAESDPQVGSLVNGKWCTSNGSTINCTSNEPAGTTTTTTGGGGCFGECACLGWCSGGDDRGDW